METERRKLNKNMKDRDNVTNKTDKQTKGKEEIEKQL